MKHICIDARLYGVKHTGIGRYVENLVDYLPSDPNIQVSLIVSSSDFEARALKKYSKVVARFHPYSIFSQLEMLLIWNKLKPDLLHVPHFSIPVLWPGKMVVTIHDLIKHISKGKDTTTRQAWLYWVKYLGYLLVVKIALFRAKHIFVPAQFWKNFLVTRYHLPSDRVSVTYEGVDTAITPGKTSTKLDIPQPFVVYTGNLYPHKNIPVLLQAIKLLQGKVKLAIVCARSVFLSRAEKMVKSLNLESDVYFLSRLTDEQMANLYSQASIFVFPSLIEGFGLTGLEAMSQKLPVIASDASCLPEIYQDAALFFDPKDPKQLRDKINELLTNKKLRSELVHNGLKLVKRYSWQKMAQETWQEYLNVLP